MTCAEVHRLVALPPEDSTRAERGAVLGHLQHCKPCLKWFNNPKNRGRSDKPIDGADLTSADMADPEYRAARFGKE